MENDNVTLLPQQPVVQHVSPRRKIFSLSSLFIVVLIVISAALGYLYYKSMNKEQKLRASNASLQNDISGLQGIVDVMKKDQLKAVYPEDVNAFTPQCEGNNDENLFIAKLNKTPVQNNNVYLTICKNDLKDKDLLVRAAVLGVDEKGNKTFKYGAGSSEPRCISSKILGAVAAELRAASGLPECKTF